MPKKLLAIVFYSFCLISQNNALLAQTSDANLNNTQSINQIEFKTPSQTPEMGINQVNPNNVSNVNETSLFVSPNSINDLSKNNVNNNQNAQPTPPQTDNTVKTNPSANSNNTGNSNNTSNPNFTPNAKDSHNIKNAIIQELPTFPTVQKTTESVERVKNYLKSGENFFNKGDLDKALEKWQAAYGLSIEMKYPEGEGAALTNMCLVFIQKNQYVKARYLGENAIELLATTSDINALARARVALAQAYFGLDNTLWAVQQLDAALKILTKEGTNNLDTAKLMNLAGSLLLKYGKYKEALQFFKQGVTSYEQAGDTVAAVNNEISVINLMQEIGLYTAAAEEATRAIETAKATKKPSLIIATLSVSANCEYNPGEYSRALKTYAEVIDLINQNSDSLKNNSDLSKANINVGLACTLIALGRNQQALGHLEEAIPKLREAGAKINEAQAMNALGIVNDRIGNYNEANRWFAEALELLTLINPTPAKLTVTYLLNQAITAYHQGSNRSAKIQIDNALNFLQKNHNDFLLSRCKLCQAQILLKLADNVNAQKALKDSIEISTKINDDQTTWRGYLLLSTIQSSQGQTAEAVDSLKSAISFFRSPLSNIHPSPESLFFVDSRNDLGFDLINQLAQNNLKIEALLALEQLKDEKFLNLYLNSIPEVKPDDKEVFEDLKSLRSHLYAAENVSKPSELITDWKSWIIRFNTLKKQNPNLASMIAPIPLSYNQVLKSLNEKNLFIVDFLTGPRGTMVFTLSGNNNQLNSKFINVNEKQLAAMVKQVLFTIGQGASLEQQKQSLHLAFQKLFSDELNSNLNTKNLVILPDSSLYNLPFSALVDNNGKFLIENYNLTLASSLRSLTSAKDSPAFSGAVFIDSEANDQDAALKFEKIFAPGLSEVINQTSINLPKLGEKLLDKSILHILDKVVINHEDPLKSSFNVTIMDKDDQKLKLADFTSMSIPNDTFILSKCSLGNNIEDGFAINMMNRSLLYAGAKNQLLSLWFLPNSNKEAILYSFYKEKSQGQDTCKAFQKALVSALGSNPKPSHWAGFQLFGQPN